jgi:hypothetical protein
MRTGTYPAVIPKLGATLSIGSYGDKIEPYGYCTEIELVLPNYVRSKMRFYGDLDQMRKVSSHRRKEIKPD